MVRDLGLNRDEFARTVQARHTAADLNHYEALIGNQLKASVKPGKVDLIVVIDGVEPNTMDKLSPSNVGVGAIYRAQSGRDGGGTAVIAPLEVFDGNTFALLALTYKGQSAGQTFDLHWTGEPYYSLPADTKEAFKASAQKAIREDIGNALRDVRLIP
jgi:hypothetical protein